MYEWEKLLEKEILNGEEKRALCYELLTEEPDMERMILKFFTEEDLKEASAVPEADRSAHACISGVFGAASFLFYRRRYL